MSVIYAVYGAGGFGQQVLSFFKTQFANDKQNDIHFFYIDDNCMLDSIDGYKMISYSEFLELNCTKKYINITIANSITRQKISQRLISDNLPVFSIISTHGLAFSNIKANTALILSPYAIISSNVKLGKFCHIGFHSSIS